MKKALVVIPISIFLLGPLLAEADVSLSNNVSVFSSGESSVYMRTKIISSGSEGEGSVEIKNVINGKTVIDIHKLIGKEPYVFEEYFEHDSVEVSIVQAKDATKQYQNVVSNEDLGPEKIATSPFWQAKKEAQGVSLNIKVEDPHLLLKKSETLSGFISKLMTYVQYIFK
jgi:hypothetical protein